jgi:hypothetical protein
VSHDASRFSDVRGRGPAIERARIWTRDDPSVPRNLPGVGSDVDAITPVLIEV